MKQLPPEKRLFCLALGIAACCLLVWTQVESYGAALEESKDDDKALVLAAQKIDDLIAKDLAKHQMAPQPRINDATFLRRTYLSLVGRIPSLAEARAFRESQVANKRLALIDTLMDTPGYRSHRFNYWADLLRAKSRANNQVSGEPFMHFIKDALEQNKPYDEFVREMLVAEGPAHKKGNGATGFIMRDRGMPLDNMANTVRLFLGTRLECAQCHNHPYDDWTQKQFFEMAAFTGGISYRLRLNDTQEGKRVQGMLTAINQGDKKGGSRRSMMRGLGQMLRPFLSGVRGGGTGLQSLPKDYQYDDASPNDFVSAHSILGQNLKLDAKPPRIPRRLEKRRAKMNPRQLQRFITNRSKDIDSRTAYAAWMTSESNPRFAQVIANRMWKLVMGRALIEPLDDIKDDTEASNPALMAYLSQLVKDLDYDLKAFEQVLYSTKLFQRASPTADFAKAASYRFQGPLLRRMSAEQLWDSMLTLIVPELDKTLEGAISPRAERVYTSYDAFMSMDTEGLKERMELENLRQKDRAKFRAKRREKMMARRKAEQAKRRQNQHLYRAYNRARRRNDQRALDEAVNELKRLGLPIPGAQRRRFGNRGNNALVRASDVQSPAPDGHFLQEFGQSAREIIDASVKVATVPQALVLLNGLVEDRLLNNPQAVLMRAIKNAPDNNAKIALAYESILSRQPEQDELATWKSEFKNGAMTASRDLVWVLTNSNEFRFVR